MREADGAITRHKTLGTDRKRLALSAAKVLPDQVQPSPEVKGMSRKVPSFSEGSSSST